MEINISKVSFVTQLSFINHEDNDKEKARVGTFHSQVETACEPAANFISTASVKVEEDCAQSEAIYAPVIVGI